MSISQLSSYILSDACREGKDWVDTSEAVIESILPAPPDQPGPPHPATTHSRMQDIINRTTILPLLARMRNTDVLPPLCAHLWAARA